jgi:hypothetical protein
MTFATLTVDVADYLHRSDLTPKMAGFIAIYVAVAALAVIALLTWNVAGFIVVVAMSAVHFGIGDAAFISEIDRRSGDIKLFSR